MKALRNYLDKIKPNFEEGGKLHAFRSVFDGFETFLFVPNSTSKTGVHIHDAIDSKRIMSIVVLALIPALLFGMFNVGYQHYLAIGQEACVGEKFLYGFLAVLPKIIVSYVVGLVRTVVLTNRDDARRNMVDSDGGFRLLDMLTAGARCTEDVNGKVGRIDFDFNRVVDFRIDVNRGKGRVTAGVGVKGTLANETVNTRFGAQRTISPFAFDVERSGLDAGHVTGTFFFQGNLKILALGVTHVHAFEHARPVLSFGTAGAGLDFQVAVGGVHRLVEHTLEFETGDFAFDGFDVLADGFDGIVIFFGHGQLKEFGRIIDALRQTVEAADDTVEQFLFFADFLGVFRIVPEIRVFNFSVDFF